MFTWLTQDPSMVYFVLAAAGLACLSAMVIKGNRVYGLGLIAVLLLALLVWIIDYLVVTDSEQVQLNTRALADAAERGDIDRLGQYISPQFNTDGLSRDQLLQRARHYLPPRPSTPRTVRVWNFETKPAADGQGLTCACSCKVTNVQDAKDDVPVYLEFDYVKESDGLWRVRRLRIMDIITGKQELIRIPR